MGMFDNVRHAGHEWQTKSIEPDLGGTLATYEVKDGRLFHHPYHMEDTGVPYIEPGPEATWLEKLQAHHATERCVDDPPVDVAFHGVLDIYRSLPQAAPDAPYAGEERRLVFAFGHLTNDVALTERVRDGEGTKLWGSWLPDLEPERTTMKLQALASMLAHLCEGELLQTPEQAGTLAALQRALAEVRAANAALPSAV